MSSVKVTVEGAEFVVRNIRSARARLATGISRGLRRAGILVLRESKKMVPVDTGVLKASGFVRAHFSGADTVVTVGYTAAYAGTVHEDLTKAHGDEYNSKHAVAIAAGFKKRRGSGQSAKYLETPVRWNIKAINKVVKDTVKENLSQ